MNKYLVIYEIEGKICEPEISTAAGVFNKMAFDDCYDISIKRLVLITPEAKLIGCVFRGAWHDFKAPLKMVIENMITGEVYDVGYAPDH
jgi:hypothetical protein